MICPNCNAETADNAKFCVTCGAPLESAGTEPLIAGQGSVDQGPVAYDQPAGGYQQQPYDAYQQPAGGYQQQPYSYAQPVQPGAYAGANEPSSAPFVLAIAALICALLLMWPVSIVLAIVALVLNSGQKKRGEVSSKQGPTTVMSIIGIIISVLMLVATIVLSVIFGAAFMQAVESGDYEVRVDGENVTLVTPGSQDASGSASTAVGDDPIVGTWEFVGAKENGKDVYTAKELEKMKQEGMLMTITAKADGTAIVHLGDEDLPGSWQKVEGFDSSYIVVADDDGIMGTVSGDTLTLGEGNGYINIFERK